MVDRIGQPRGVQTVAIAIAIAGAFGALARYGVGRPIGFRSFPWATLAINVAGYVLLGFLMRSAIGRQWSPVLTSAVSIGFLGAFTTFSTFSVEMLILLRDGRVVDAALYAGASVIGGVAAAALGYAVVAAVDM